MYHNQLVWDPGANIKLVMMKEVCLHILVLLNKLDLWLDLKRINL